MLGDKIKSLRKSKKINQQQLADSVNLSRSAIGMIEANKNGASSEKLKEIADFFGVTVDYLLSDDDDNQIEKKERDYSLTIKEQENIASEAQQILDELSMSFSKNKDMLTEEDYFAIENALKITLESIKIKNKKKFTPKKYK